MSSTLVGRLIEAAKTRHAEGATHCDFCFGPDATNVFPLKKIGDCVALVCDKQCAEALQHSMLLAQKHMSGYFHNTNASDATIGASAPETDANVPFDLPPLVQRCAAARVCAEADEDLDVPDDLPGLIRVGDCEDLHVPDDLPGLIRVGAAAEAEAESIQGPLGALTSGVREFFTGIPKVNETITHITTFSRVFSVGTGQHALSHFEGMGGFMAKLLDKARTSEGAAALYSDLANSYSKYTILHPVSFKFADSVLQSPDTALTVLKHLIIRVAIPEYDLNELGKKGVTYKSLAGSDITIRFDWPGDRGVYAKPTFPASVLVDAADAAKDRLVKYVYYSYTGPIMHI